MMKSVVRRAEAGTAKYACRHQAPLSDAGPNGTWSGLARGLGLEQPRPGQRGRHGRGYRARLTESSTVSSRRARFGDGAVAAGIARRRGARLQGRCRGPLRPRSKVDAPHLRPCHTKSSATSPRRRVQRAGSSTAWLKSGPYFGRRQAILEHKRERVASNAAQKRGQATRSGRAAAASG